LEDFTVSGAQQSIRTTLTIDNSTAPAYIPGADEQDQQAVRYLKTKIFALLRTGLDAHLLGLVY
jgi:hypothetical protein